MTDTNRQSMKTDEYWMQLALDYAKQAAQLGEVPVGAILIGDDGMLAGAGNGPISRNDPTAHAEILALRAAAAKLGNYRLVDTTLYVTLEPCIMCMGAIVHARVKRLVYGAADPKTGAASSVYRIGSDELLNHRLAVSGGILADNCSNILKDFFKKRRAGTA